jgi:iron complex outermembrane receptor protein
MQPGGELRAAVCADYVSDPYKFIDTNTINSPSTAAVLTTPSIGKRTVWAVYTEVNAPIFGEMNALPLIRKLDLQVSWRHDHYNDFGGTSNPRIALDWMPAEFMTIRGSWGTSFRAPAFAETSAVAGRVIQPVNAAAGSSGGNNVRICAQNATNPVAGSAGADLIAAGLGFNCNSFPGGITVGGGSDGLAGVTRPAGFALGPEKAKSWSVGVQFLPDFAPGLDMHATYFWTEVTDTIAGGGTDLLNPFDREHILIKGDPGFDAAVAAIVSNPLSTVNPTFAPQISFIQEGASRNLGSMKLDGIDFFAGYDFELGNYGFWDASITGTYYLHRETVGGPGQDAEDAYDSSDDRPGETREARFRYRARVGWNDGDGFNIGLILNYRSHFFHGQAYPPQCFISGPVCYAGAEQFPDYSNHVPANYLFDVSMAYDLMDRPVNPYLKNIKFALVVNNVFDHDPSFVYRVAANGGAFAHDASTTILGRVFNVTITKTW